MDDFRVFLFLYLVQTGIMVYLGLALFNIKLSRMRLALCTTILGLSLWLIRGAYTLLGISFGTHTLVITLVFILVIKYVGGQNWGIAIGATLVTMTLVTIGGGASQVFVHVFHLTPEQILGSVWLHILMGYIESIFLFLMLLLNKAFGFTIVNYLDIE